MLRAFRTVGQPLRSTLTSTLQSARLPAQVMPARELAMGARLGPAMDARPGPGVGFGMINEDGPFDWDLYMRQVRQNSGLGASEPSRSAFGAEGLRPHRQWVDQNQTRHHAASEQPVLSVNLEEGGQVEAFVHCYAAAQRVSAFLPNHALVDPLVRSLDDEVPVEAEPAATDAPTPNPLVLQQQVNLSERLEQLQARQMALGGPAAPSPGPSPLAAASRPTWRESPLGPELAGLVAAFAMEMAGGNVQAGADLLMKGMELIDIGHAGLRLHAERQSSRGQQADGETTGRTDPRFAEFVAEFNAAVESGGFQKALAAAGVASLALALYELCTAKDELDKAQQAGDEGAVGRAQEKLGLAFTGVCLAAAGVGSLSATGKISVFAANQAIALYQRFSVDGEASSQPISRADHEPAGEPAPASSRLAGPALAGVSSELSADPIGPVQAPPARLSSDSAPPSGPGMGHAALAGRRPLASAVPVPGGPIGLPGAFSGAHLRALAAYGADEETAGLAGTRQFLGRLATLPLPEALPLALALGAQVAGLRPDERQLVVDGLTRLAGERGPHAIGAQHVLAAMTIA